MGLELRRYPEMCAGDSLEAAQRALKQLSARMEMAPVPLGVLAEIEELRGSNYD